MPLDRKSIVQQAFAELNASGLDGLTLRKLAARLEVQAPAIYWHFKSKQDLLDEMATEVLRQSTKTNAPLDSIKDWREWALASYRGLRAVLLRYRDGAKMFSGTYLTDVELFAPMEAHLRRLTAAGFNLQQAVVGLTTLYDFTIGFVIEEQATQLEPGKPNPLYDLAVREQRVKKQLYPLASKAGAHMFQHNDERFADGLALILGGLEAQLARAGATS